MGRGRSRPGLWVRIHDRIWQDERVLDLAMRGDKGLAAVAVFVMSVAWTHHAKRDGEVPRGALVLIHGRAHHADLLVKSGLWEATKDGWRIPKYEVWQDTAAEIEESRQAKAAAGHRRACLRWHSQPCTDPGCRAGRSNVVQMSVEERSNG